jgi:hypothetical protein
MDLDPLDQKSVQTRRENLPIRHFYKFRVMDLKSIGLTIS